MTKVEKLELFTGHWRFASEDEIKACCGASSDLLAEIQRE